MPPLVMGKCAACGASTDQRCSGCAVDDPLFFCSRDHQKLLWESHKVLCGRDTDCFFFAPLDEPEMEVFRGLRPASPKGGFGILLMEDMPPDWETLDPLLTAPAALKTNFYIFSARCMISKDAPRATQLRLAKTAPWQMVADELSNAITLMAQYPLAYDQEDCYPYQLLNPYLRALLHFSTVIMRLKATHKPERFPGLQVSLTYLFGDLERAINQCQFGDCLKAALRDRVRFLRDGIRAAGSNRAEA
ncbi:hypothetical protein JCM10213_007581 [Rhodosporidiobolus nylandii]